MIDKVDQLMSQALQARRENRFDDAKRDLVEAVVLCREAHEPGELARALADLGQIERDMHHNDAALRHYEEAVALYRDQGDPLKLAHAIRHVADIQRHVRNHQLAESCYDETLRIYREHPETPPLDLANALRGWALLKETMGEIEEARARWQEAGRLYADVHVEAGVTESNRRLKLLTV
ncbi:MAG TPA: tetratricopeptide repeat protein [Candidatus Sulfotelmatobacter sp.]|jgi:tetratricopeptide (TPR) repeat protein